jgi:hypothetical protein
MAEQRLSSAEDRRPTETPADAAFDLDERTNDTAAAARPSLTRRRLIQGLAAGGATLGAVAMAAPATTAAEGAAGGVARQATPTLPVAEPVDVTLLTSAEPGSLSGVGAMPSREEQDADPTKAAYAEVLQTWLDANPGVQIESIGAEFTSQEQLVPAIAGGTAPSWYGGWLLGGGTAELGAAFKQGLIADVTDPVQRYDITGSISEVARNLWAQHQVDGRYYSLPGDIIFAGTGMFYRADLIREAGLAAPAFGWTWPQARELAKALTSGNRKGLGMPVWGLGLYLNTEGWDLLTKLPAPDQDWNWRWDYTSQADKWVGLLQNYRAMRFADESVYADITVDMPQLSEAFLRGDIAMAPLVSAFMNPDPTGGFGLMARDAGAETIDEIVGFAPLPVGTDGFFGTTQPNIADQLYNPDLDETALDKAVGLYHYLWYGQGYVWGRQAIWELTQDPSLVFNAAAPVNGMDEIPGVPGSIADVWPKQFLAAVEQMNTIPLVPAEGEFIPAEENPGPTGTAWDDMQSRWTFEPGDLDLAADLEELESLRNAEAAGFESSVPDDAFVAGAKAYYEAHDRFWREHAPEFHAAVFQPWYEAQILPALG